ncbi:MAG TPA: biotin/lipoyl-containing protein [Chloroflexota bacterium]
MPRDDQDSGGATDPDPAHVVEDLLGLLQGTTISELDLEWKGLHVRIRREPTLDVELGVGSAGVTESHEGGRREDGMVVIPSSYVGTFRRDSETRLPDLGDDVRAGTRIAEVEVLGVRNPVAAPVDGIVSAFLVEDEAPVEYGQPLVLLKPAAHSE